MSTTKTLRRILSGNSDAAIRFDDLCALLDSLNFEKRVSGSRHLFRKSGVEERINLQRDGNKREAVPSQTGAGVILRYKLGDTK